MLSDGDTLTTPVRVTAKGRWDSRALVSHPSSGGGHEKPTTWWYLNSDEIELAVCGMPSLGFCPRASEDGF